MTEEELKIFFLNIFKSCYKVKHDNYPDSIFLYYDKSFIRNIKLCKISNQVVNLPTKIVGVCLFEYDTKNYWLNCDYDLIWSIFYTNYNNNFNDVKLLISKLLINLDDSIEYKPRIGFLSNDWWVDDKNKLSVII